MRSMLARARGLLARAWPVLQDGAAAFTARAGNRDAAQVAFFVLISFPPALLLAVWGFSVVLDNPGVEEDIVDAISEALPLSSAGRSDVEQLLEGVARGAGAVGLLGALVLLYATSNAVRSLRYAFNAAFRRSERRPFVPARALDVAVTLIAGPALLGALGLSLLNTAPELLDERPLLAGLVGLLVTRLAPAALVLATLYGLYTVLPDGRARPREALVGALTAAAGLALVQAGATVYFTSISDRSAVYGTIGALLVASLSVYAASIAVVLGADVAAESGRQAAGIRPARPAAQRPAPPLAERLRSAVRALFVREP